MIGVDPSRPNGPTMPVCCLHMAEARAYVEVGVRKKEYEFDLC